MNKTRKQTKIIYVKINSTYMMNDKESRVYHQKQAKKLKYHIYIKICLHSESMGQIINFLPFTYAKFSTIYFISKHLQMHGSEKNTTMSQRNNTLDTYM